MKKNTATTARRSAILPAKMATEMLVEDYRKDRKILIRHRVRAWLSRILGEMLAVECAIDEGELATAFTDGEVGELKYTLDHVWSELSTVCPQIIPAELAEFVPNEK